MASRDANVNAPTKITFDLILHDSVEGRINIPVPVAFVC
jgi:hypothetical protein